MPDQNRQVVILGAGYTGKALACVLLERGYVCVATSRDPEAGGGGLPERVRWVQFDLGREGTWVNLPRSWGLVWLFPAEPCTAVKKIIPVLSRLYERLVVIGTTSSYLQTQEEELVTEETPLDRRQPRVEGEEILRALGAIVLRSAGIYGPGRNPMEWLRKGMIADGEKYVNLIHVEDLAGAIIAGLESPVVGREYIVSDGHPRRWSEIAEWAKARGILKEPHFIGMPRKCSRRLSNQRLLKEISSSLTHGDLFAELEHLNTR